mgnify:CR=1 FL=1
MTYPNDNFNDRNFTTGNTDLPTGEYRYDKDSIHQDAASGQAQQTAASGHHPSDANKKSTGRGKKGTALLLAGCLVLSMVGGAGGAVIAAKSGLLGTGSTVLYQGVEVPSTNGSTVGVSYSGVVQQVEDSVVAITTESVATNYFFRQYVTQGAGSGVVLTADGYIVTNYHVIKGAQQITVTANDGSTYAATLVGTDEDNDIAVLKVDAKDLTPAILGDSDTLKVGDAVLAIGNPLGTLSGTVTDGIVSALERQVTIDGNNMTAIPLRGYFTALPQQEVTMDFRVTAPRTKNGTLTLNTEPLKDMNDYNVQTRSLRWTDQPARYELVNLGYNNK